MSKYFITFMCLFVLHTSKAQQGILDYGTDYRNKLIKLEKAIYLSSSAEEQNQYLLEKAGLYKESGEHEKAIMSIERLHYMLLTDSMQSSVRFDAAVNAFLCGRFDEANTYCDLALTTATESHPLLSEIYLVKVLSFNELILYDSAYVNSVRFVNHRPLNDARRDSILQSLKDLYSSENLPRFRDIERAERLSGFFPGLGQCYSGYCLEGLASFATHLALAGTTAYAVYKAYYLSAYFGGVSMFMRFYFGSVPRTSYLAKKRNYLLQKQFSDKSKLLLKKAY